MDFHLFGRLRIKSRDQLHQNAPPDFAHYTAHGDNENSIRATVAKEVAQGMGTEETTATRIKSFISVLNLHFLVHVGQLAAFQQDPAETDFAFREGLIRLDHKVERGFRTSEQAQLVFRAGDHPACCLANYLALVIEQEHLGAGGFHLLLEGILHREFDEHLPADLLWRVHLHDQVG
jgi:hypothetical protein